MQKHPAIRVIPVDLELRPALSRLRVLPAQLNDVGAFGNLLADATHCPGSEPMAIPNGDTLTMNRNNHAASHLYLHAGFDDSG